MTAPWDAGPCDGPSADQLEQQLAEAEADYWSRANTRRLPPQDTPESEPAIKTVNVIEGIL